MELETYGNWAKHVNMGAIYILGLMGAIHNFNIVGHYDLVTTLTKKSGMKW